MYEERVAHSIGKHVIFFLSGVPCSALDLELELQGGYVQWPNTLRWGPRPRAVETGERRRRAADLVGCGCWLNTGKEQMNFARDVETSSGGHLYKENNITFGTLCSLQMMGGESGNNSSIDHQVIHSPA